MLATPPKSQSVRPETRPTPAKPGNKGSNLQVVRERSLPTGNTLVKDVLTSYKDRERERSKKDTPAPNSLKDKTQDNFLEILLCPPRYLSTEIANNAWMKKMKAEDKKVNIDKAMSQFFTLYGLLAQDAMAYLLPPNPGLQDEVYISNAGMLLPHLKEKTFVLSNFKAEGRPGEERVLNYFLKLTDFKQHFCPYKWEGEAETKWLRDNIYFFGYGMRSDVKAFKWMEEKFNCRGIYIHETDPLRYHLDCSIFPINRECVLLADDIPSGERKQIESVAEVVLVSKKDSQEAITNCVRVGSIIYNATTINNLKRTEDEYKHELHKNETLEKICSDKGLSLVWVNLSELEKSGAALSCCVLHLSRIAYPA